ncbi:hypothetical protein RI543_004080 [Arxiozyma heterogenica]|uniref:Uncharacterized protein n=1 Tax=Arxiozyma heterogenica TaxID=278026 RepID=A0AAN7WN44_9SACH|nr:hypothetical protein RI543_004080 [Kazachstania heterogenica]
MFSQLKRMESQCRCALQSSKSGLLCKCAFNCKCSHCESKCKCSSTEVCQCDKECECTHCKQCDKECECAHCKQCDKECECAHCKQCDKECECAHCKQCDKECECAHCKQCDKECECAHCKQIIASAVLNNASVLVDPVSVTRNVNVPTAIYHCENDLELKRSKLGELELLLLVEDFNININDPSEHINQLANSKEFIQKSINNFKRYQ